MNEEQHFRYGDSAKCNMPPEQLRRMQDGRDEIDAFRLHRAVEDGQVRGLLVMPMLNCRFMWVLVGGGAAS